MKVSVISTAQNMPNIYKHKSQSVVSFRGQGEDRLYVDALKPVNKKQGLFARALDKVTSVFHPLEETVISAADRHSEYIFYYENILSDELQNKITKVSNEAINKLHEEESHLRSLIDAMTNNIDFIETPDCHLRLSKLPNGNYVLRLLNSDDSIQSRLVYNPVTNKTISVYGHLADNVEYLYLSRSNSVIITKDKKEVDDSHVQIGERIKVSLDEPARNVYESRISINGSEKQTEFSLVQEGDGKYSIFIDKTATTDGNKKTSIKYTKNDEDTYTVYESLVENERTCFESVAQKFELDGLDLVGYQEGLVRKPDEDGVMQSTIKKSYKLDGNGRFVKVKK